MIKAMKKVLLLVGLALVQWLSFELQAQCNHRVGFGRSAVADSVDALHYKIHINAIDFTAKSIQAVAEKLRFGLKLVCSTFP